MFAQAYICKDNQNLKEIVDEICISWESKYIGRKIIPDKYNELFDHNGYYFENDQYSMYGIIANIKPSVDENGYITEISSYKVKDNTCGHGRPQTEDKDFTKRDISHFSKILDSVTVDHVGALYEELKGSFVKGENLPGGYRFVSATAKGITLESPSGNTVLLSKTKILQGLLISHTFIDVLFSVDTLKSAPEYFEGPDLPLYLAIFSKVDYSKYRNYALLMEEANNRELLRKAEAGYPLLVEAVKAEDCEKIASLIQFAPLVIINRDPFYEPPIITAVQKGNVKIARMLLEGGVFSKESYIDAQKNSISPLHIAVQQQNYEMIKLLCQFHGAEEHQYSSLRHNFWISNPHTKFKLADVFGTIGELQDFEALKIILPYAALSPHKTAFNPQVFSNLDDTDIDFILSIEGAAINWPTSFISKAYLADRSKCFDMLQQGCELEAIDFFIENNDFELYEKAVACHTNIRPRSSFHAVYERGGKWYEIAQNASPPGFNFMEFRQDRDKYLAKLIQEEHFDTFKSAVKNMGIPFPIDALDAFINHPKGDPVSEKMQSFFDYVLDHCEYTGPSALGRTITDVSFSFFADALLCNASTGTVKRYLQEHPKLVLCDNDSFKKAFENLVLYRKDDVYTFLLKTKLEIDTLRTTPTNWSTYFGFSDYRQETIYKTFQQILISYRHQEDNLSHDYSWVNKDTAQLLASRWIQVLRGIVQLISIAEINEAIRMCKNKRRADVTSALEFAVAERIQSQEVIELLRE